MFFASEYGQICQIDRTENGDYIVIVNQGDGFFRGFVAGRTAQECRAWIVFHFGRA